MDKKKTSKKSIDVVTKILQQSVEIYKKGDFDGAHKLLNKASENAEGEVKLKFLYAIHDLFLKKNPDIAIEALDNIIVKAPELSIPLVLKARILEKQRKAKLAIDACLQLTKLEATNQELVEVARILSRFGDQNSALEAAKKAYIRSGEDVSLATYPLRVCLQNADWDTSDKICKKITLEHKAGNSEKIGETPRTHLLWCDDEQINHTVIQNFGKKNVALDKPILAKHLEGDFTKRKVRIGYLSNDFRDHPTSYLALGLLRHHNLDRFEIYLYDTSYDDNSVMRREILSRANYARTLSKLTDAQAAQVIYKDKIDVLIDLNGLTEGNRLGIFNYRPAPIQISYLGFPGSTGHPQVDYVIADEYTLPRESEQYYQESIIRIPDTYQINDYIAQYLPPRPSRKKWGLPDDKIIIGMFNNVNKVGREVWDTWLKIMKATPQSILWLLDPGPVAKENLMVHAKLMGVDEDRFVWAKKVRPEKHLARLQLCAIALDPWPYGGHTTTSDAIFAGVPVIALQGRNFPSRVSGGILRASGLESLIAENLEKYIKISIQLINDKSMISKLKRHLYQRRRSLPLFDAPGRTLHIESAYLYACNVAEKKMKRESFNVKIKPNQPRNGS